MANIYQICVRGQLSQQRAQWFDGLSVENLPDGEALISGPVPDQAALHGLLIRIRDLGLPLLSVVQAEPIEDLSQARVDEGNTHPINEEQSK